MFRALFLFLSFALSQHVQAGDVKAPETVAIPGNCFTMGFWYEDDPEESRYKVCLKPYEIMKYEVTNTEFALFDPSHDSGYFDGRPLNKPMQPVVNVSRQQAEAYATWLSEKTGAHYRLPTEAEWEYAAKADTKTEAFWGDDLDLSCDYANIGDRVARKQYRWIIWHDCKDGAVVTNQVGQYKPNPFGLYDILGNAAEWTCSEYEEPFAGKEQICDSSEGYSYRVYRGGSWATKPDYNGTTVRMSATNAPAEGLWDVRLKSVAIGFRLVKVP